MLVLVGNAAPRAQLPLFIDRFGARPTHIFRFGDFPVAVGVNIAALVDKKRKDVRFANL